MTAGLRRHQMSNHRPYELTGYICPRCGGVLSKMNGTDDTHSDGGSKYRCRIGHVLTAAELWVETCAMRNRALGEAARTVAETIDLANALAQEARTAGNETLAARLQEEAQSEKQYVGQLIAMLEDLAADAPEGQLLPEDS